MEKSLEMMWMMEAKDTSTRMHKDMYDGDSTNIKTSFWGWGEGIGGL